ncbi:MAG: tRNA-dihydrouridine synthase [Chloroflexi bacterium]|nr:tRNA-dihydrouridine synthase [Chloroflexota bacterium]
MIDLAPSHKRGLALKSPLLNAAGTLGFADEYAALIDFARLGAFVTNAITARPRTPARGDRVCEFAGGALIHTGLPNPGVGEAIRQYARKWARMPCPIVVHVAATTPDEVATCVQRLEAVDNVAGIELGFRDEIATGEAVDLITAAAQLASLPVLARLPLIRAEELCQVAVNAGAQALVVASPPRGTVRLSAGEWLTGRLYGPAYFPLALNAVRSVTSKVKIPMIGAGGIHTLADAQAMLAAGAAAVEVDSAAWRDPRTFERIALGLA